MKELKCSICGCTIKDKMGWKYGNNAQPINNGRCCDNCNDMVVVPQRIINSHRKGDKVSD